MSHKFFFDIETIPDQDPGAYDKYLDAVEPPGNYKNEDSKAKWMLENSERVALENFQKTSLDGLYGEICSIAWAIDDGTIKNHIRLGSDPESDLLEAFWEDMYRELRELGGKDGNWPQIEWIGHNILEFDLRFLKKRSIINQVEPHRNIPADARHGSGHVFDTMKEWMGFRGYIKQDALFDAFGLEIPLWAEAARDNDGSMVWHLWRNGDYDLLSTYNKLDVFKVREIYKKMVYR